MLFYANPVSSPYWNATTEAALLKSSSNMTLTYQQDLMYTHMDPNKIRSTPAGNFLDPRPTLLEKYSKQVEPSNPADDTNLGTTQTASEIFSEKKSESVVDVLPPSKSPKFPGAVAKSIMELMVKHDVEPEKAAAMIGVSKDAIPPEVFKQSVLDKIKNYALPSEAVRELVRAGRNQVIMEGLVDGGDRKLALEAMKQSAGDPSVGLTAPPTPPVQISIGSLQAIIDKNKTLDESDIFREE